MHKTCACITGCNYRSCLEPKLSDNIVLHLVEGANGERSNDAHHDYRWNQKKKTDVCQQPQRSGDPRPHRHRSTSFFRFFDDFVTSAAAGSIGRQRTKDDGQRYSGDDAQQEYCADDEDQARIGRRERLDVFGDERAMLYTAYADVRCPVVDRIDV